MSAPGEQVLYDATQVAVVRHDDVVALARSLARFAADKGLEPAQLAIA